VSVAKKSLSEAALRLRLATSAAAEGGPLNGAVPVRWEQNPTWRCSNCHVSQGFIEGRRGVRLCVFKYCGEPVELTFPEDRSGPLT
jgi:hypothetical protein